MTLICADVWTFEKRFAEIMHRFASRGLVPDYHQAKIDEFETKKAALHARLAPEDEFREHPVKSEIKKDIEDLMNSFERWIEHVDEDFQVDLTPDDKGGGHC
jgi:hypothetical protein